KHPPILFPHSFGVPLNSYGKPMFYRFDSLHHPVRAPAAYAKIRSYLTYCLVVEAIYPKGLYSHYIFNLRAFLEEYFMNTIPAGRPLSVLYSLSANFLALSVFCVTPIFLASSYLLAPLAFKMLIYRPTHGCIDKLRTSANPQYRHVSL